MYPRTAVHPFTLSTSRGTTTPTGVGITAGRGVTAGGNCTCTLAISPLSYVNYNIYINRYPAGSLGVISRRSRLGRRSMFSCYMTGIARGTSVTSSTGIVASRCGGPLLRFSNSYTNYTRATCTHLIARLFNSEVCVSGTANYSSV